MFQDKLKRINRKHIIGIHDQVRPFSSLHVAVARRIIRQAVVAAGRLFIGWNSGPAGAGWRSYHGLDDRDVRIITAAAKC